MAAAAALMLLFLPALHAACFCIKRSGRAIAGDVRLPASAALICLD
jgi:hypothetical protein